MASIDMPLVPSSLIHQVCGDVCIYMYGFVSFVCVSGGRQRMRASLHVNTPTTPYHHHSPPPPPKKYNTSPNQPTNQQSFLLSTLSHALLPHLSLLGPSDAVGLHPLAIVGMCGAIASAFSALPVGAFRTKGLGDRLA